MLNELKNELNVTRTINGAAAYYSSLDYCLDLFAAIGSMRNDPEEAKKMLIKAFCESPDYAVRILFYARDIRSGLGERDIFRSLLRELAFFRPESVNKNLKYISEYGRSDDLFVLFGTPCEKNMLDFVTKQLREDIANMRENKSVSLLGKWMPSINCSDANRREQAKKICRNLKIQQKEYRKILSELRAYIDIIETHLCKKKYDFDYEHIPSNASFKYRRAFIRNDKMRYGRYIKVVRKGEKILHADTLFPYEIVRNCIANDYADSFQRSILDTTWKAMSDSLAAEMKGKNALAVVDGSGSMYTSYYSLHCNAPAPIHVAISLGLYFAERTEGYFRDHFITFSESPKLVKIKGYDIYSKVRYCMEFNDYTNTDLEKTFVLLLKTALDNNIPKSEMPEYLYIISDMEFDCCTEYNETIFHAMKKLYSENGYELPQIVFWNVNHLSYQLPVTKDEEGAVLVSGFSKNLFNFCVKAGSTPLEFMKSIIDSERYSCLSA